MADDERMDEVDVNPGAHHATEEDEEQVLRSLYGEPCDGGIYHGTNQKDAQP